MQPRTLPSLVVLPEAPMINAAHLRLALRVSKAVLCLWRRHAGFPNSYRVGRTAWTLCEDVAGWCERHGAKVTRR